MSPQSRKPVPEECHSIMTWVIFRLRAVGLFACWAPQCKHPEALMQKLRACSSPHTLLPHAFSLSPSLTLWMFTAWLVPLVEYTLSSSSSLASFLPSLPAIFCPAWLHARPSSPWLLTSKRHFIHQSVIRKRGPFSSVLKEREGTRSDFIKRRGGQVYEKRTWERKRIRSWPQGISKHKSRGMQLWVHISRVAFARFFCPSRCFPIPHAWSRSHFPHLLSHLSFIPFTWAISTKGCQGLFLPVIHHSTCVCVCVSLLSSISKSHPLNFHRLCARWHFPSPPHFKVAGGPVFRSLGIAIASLLSWSLVHTQLHKHDVHSPTDGFYIWFGGPVREGVSTRLLCLLLRFCFSALGFIVCMQDFIFKLWCLKLTWNT